MAKRAISENSTYSVFYLFLITLLLLDVGVDVDVDVGGMWVMGDG